MTSADFHTGQQRQYRVALLLPQSHRLLVEREHQSTRLPRLDIPRWRRPAEALTKELSIRWNLSSVLIDDLPSQYHLPCCAVLEIRPDEQFRIPDGLTAVAPEAIAASELSHIERTVLAEILTGDAGDRGPFSRTGWIEEAQLWIQKAVSSHSVAFTEDIRQLNASGTFALIRFGTLHGPSYWLKATGSPNKHEYDVTTTLSRCFPQSLPPLVAAREDWNAWVTEEAGQPLSECLTQLAFDEAVLALAQLQKQSCRRIGELLAAGCPHRGIPVLQSNVPQLIDYLEEAMQQQTSTKVPPLDRQRLRRIGTILHAACFEMQELRIPDALILNDTNLGNILFDGSHCVFTDMAEAYVGNPFLTYERLRVQVANCVTETQTRISPLRCLYSLEWLDLLSDTSIKRALALAPLLAIASYLYGRGDWLESPQRYDAYLQSYHRSLARHLDRAAQAPELGEALCH